MPAIFEHHLQVGPEAIDGVGHVNNLEYVRWLQDAAVAHSSAQGWPPKAYRELGHGWVVRTHTIEYLAPAYLNDEIVVRTWIADMKRVTSLRRYEMFRKSDQKKLIMASTNWAFVRFSDHQICRIPASVSDCFQLVADAN
ncbi:MAG: acyl-CoA thioesterase [Planctomyces sp.]|nr:acyl-CoA thioesterase [Planctomyces sp.]